MFGVSLAEISNINREVQLYPSLAPQKVAIRCWESEPEGEVGRLRSKGMAGGGEARSGSQGNDGCQTVRGREGRIAAVSQTWGVHARVSLPQLGPVSFAAARSPAIGQRRREGEKGDEEATKERWRVEQEGKRERADND